MGDLLSGWRIGILVTRGEAAAGGGEVSGEGFDRGWLNGKEFSSNWTCRET